MSKARELASLGNAYSDGSLSNRNLIINGAMQVAQRGTSVSGITTGGYKTTDRIGLALSGLGTWTCDNSSDAPSGFSNSHKVTCTVADASPASTDFALISYLIEAQSLQHLAYGTSAAKPLTLSFWVKSNKAGAASLDILQYDNSNRFWGDTYVINSADTWEHKTLSIPADTAGLIRNDNGAGLSISIWLNGGSNFTGGSAQTVWGAYTPTKRNVSNIGVGGAVNDYFAITGVQLEVGDTATPFEHRSYGQELALCQRYYIKSPELQAQKRVWNSSGVYLALCISADFPVVMRANPSMTVYGDISDGSQTTLGGAGLFGVSYGFSAFTNISNGAFVDMHYYIADAEL